MKSIIPFILCIVCNPFISSSQVNDDFSDGNFTENHAWIGDEQHFEVNVAGQLHLVSAGSDTSHLATPNQRMSGTEWSFWIKLAFNTSVNNHARVYLAADTSALTGLLNGYFLQIGGSDDSILFMRQEGSALTPVYTFKHYRTAHSTNTLRFRIREKGDGRWEAMIDTTGGYGYLSDGHFEENSITRGGWFGIVCRYTASNALKFYFDEIYVGPILYDTIPPGILLAETLGSSILRLGFSEPVDPADAANRENYQLQSLQRPVDSVKFENGQPAAVLVYLHDPMPDGTLDTLLIRNIRDTEGNVIRDTAVGICHYTPKPFDILIHEIMADPDPAIGLPPSEYVELYNRSGYPVNVRGWSLRYGSFRKTFPSVTIPPDQYLLVGRDPVLKDFGAAVLLFTTTSSLANEEAEIVLYDSRNHVIHTVTYSAGWHRAGFKNEGGWSLEMMDPENPCGCVENWSSSMDAAGGTPGRQNSISGIRPDREAPFILRGVIRDSVTTEIFFSEQMDSLSICDPASWSVTNGQNVLRPVEVQHAGPGFGSARLLMSTPFRIGELWSVGGSDRHRDCAGNRCDTLKLARIAFPDTVWPGEVVINEFLPDPASGGERFAEIYNRSGKVLDLQTLMLASGGNNQGEPPDAGQLSGGPYLLFPGDYLAFSPDAADIINRYDPENQWTILSVVGFPSFSQDSGEVILLRRHDLAVIDRMAYDPSLQNPLLANAEGVSLERFDPDLPSASRSNWHAAAASSGYATPGYRNSQQSRNMPDDGVLSVEPGIFSPDNDGHDDILSILLRPGEPGCTLDLLVADARGRIIRQLANNVLSGLTDLYTWDGVTASGEMAPAGIYLLLARFTSPAGMVKRYRTTVVLAGKLSR